MIRFAEEQDINGIMAFIDSYWKKGHILGNNKEFFEYEHKLPEGVTYVISEDEVGTINAILGYIPYGTSNRDVMTVMWKAKHTKNSSLGLELFKFLQTNGDVRIMASPGSNPNLKGLYKYLGYQFGKMNHWYRLKPQVSYRVAKITDPSISVSFEQNRCKYQLFEEWNTVVKCFDFDRYSHASKPYKEPWYIQKRYFNHPIYNYEVYGVSDEYTGEMGLYPLMVVFRIIDVDDAKVVRLIDCMGDFDLISNTANLLDDILERYNAEYVDCYESGIPESVMKQAGLKNREDTDNIIPNYFSPFVQQNIDIWYFSTDANIVLFKGDGDQDRPN